MRLFSSLAVVAATLVACSGGAGTTGDLFGADGGLFQGQDGGAVDGGGAPVDSGSGAGDAGELPTPPPLPGAAYGAKCPGFTAAELSDWEKLAVVRGAAGLGAVDCDPALHASVRAHANYCTLNGCGDPHAETPGKPGFTGVDLGARARAAGFTGPTTLEVYGPFGLMLGSVYHRLPYLAWESAKYGEARGDAVENGFWDFASGGAKPPVAVYSWPADGGTNIPYSFIHVVEGPDPLPSVAEPSVGYPVSVHATGALVVSAAKIQGPEGELPNYLVTAANDRTGFLRNEAFLMAKAPLAASTSYQAEFRGTIDGAAFTKVIRFTTGTQSIDR
jgi:hypothetical protein